MKNLYQNKNTLPEELDLNIVKSAWKKNKKHSSSLHILYMFLTKTDLEASINKAFSPYSENGNKVIKSYFFHKETQYQSLLLLLSGIAKYSMKQEFLNTSIIKNLRYNRYRDTTREEQQIHDEIQSFLSEVKMTEKQFMKLYATICSYYLYINDQRRLFRHQNIVYCRNADRSQRKRILQKLNEDPQNNNMRGLIQFSLLISKLGNTENRILKSYSKRKNNYNNDKYLKIHYVYEYEEKLVGGAKMEALFYHKRPIITKRKLLEKTLLVCENQSDYNENILLSKGLLQHLISLDECSSNKEYLRALTGLQEKNRDLTLLALFVLILAKES